MHISSGNLFQLNRVATRIWDALDAPITVGNLFARLEAQFDVSPERCRTEVGALLVELQSQGLVRIN
jgi:hypothetical protein